MSTFEWPWQYNFPPFFTIQPNLETRKAQMAAWRTLFLNYCNDKKIYSIEVKQIINEPIFKNQSINRQLSNEAIQTVLEDVHQHGNLEWLDKNHTKALVYWKSPSEWGKLIYNWANEKSLINTVCTFYEILYGDDTVDCEFHGLDEQIFKNALQSLENENKAVVISFDGNQGVKFL